MTLFKVDIAIYLILDLIKFIIFELLDLKDQIIFFIYYNFNILIYIEEDLDKLSLIRSILVIIIDLYFFLRFIFKYNLSSLIKYNIELLITKFDTSLI